MRAPFTAKTRITSAARAGMALGAGGMLVLLAACAGTSVPGAEETSAAPLENVVGVEVPTEYVDNGLKAGMFCATGMISYCDADGATAHGILADFAEAWAGKFGVRADVEGTTWEALMPGTLSGRTDVIVGIGDRPERQEDFTFIDLFWSYQTIIVPDGNPEGIEGPDDLCGLTMSAATGSGEMETVLAFSDDCVAQGLEPIAVDEYGEQAATFLAVQSGRADATVTDVFAATDLMDENAGVYAGAFDTEADTLWGVAVPRENQELIDAVAAGVQASLEDGTFDRILREDYDFDQDVLVDSLMINGEVVE